MPDIAKLVIEADSKNINLASKRLAALKKQAEATAKAMKTFSEDANRASGTTATIGRTGANDLTALQKQITNVNTLQQRGFMSEQESIKKTITLRNNLANTIKTQAIDSGKLSKTQGDYLKKNREEVTKLTKTLSTLRKEQSGNIAANIEAEYVARRFYTSMFDLGRLLTVTVTPAIIAASVASVKFSNELNEGLGKIQTLIPDNTGAIDGLGDAIQQASINSAKGLGELTQGMYQTISVFQYGEDTAKQFNVAVKASVAGVSTVEESVGLLSSVTKAYGDTSEEAVQKVSDLAFLTVKLGKTEFPELANAMQVATDRAVRLGVSQEELFGVFSALTGITGDASMVATQFRSALDGLLTPSASLEKAMEELNITSIETAISEQGLVNVLKEINDYSERTGISLQKLIRRKEGVTLVSRLATQQFDDFNEKMKELNDSAGATDKAFRAFTTGANIQTFALRQNQQAIKTNSAEIGQSLLPALNALLSPIASVTKAFAEMSDIAKFFSHTILAFAATAGPMMLFIGVMGKATMAIKAFKISMAASTGLMATFAALAPAIIIVAGAIAVLTASLIALEKVKIKNIAEASKIDASDFGIDEKVLGKALLAVDRELAYIENVAHAYGLSQIETTDMVVEALERVASKHKLELDDLFQILTLREDSTEEMTKQVELAVNRVESLEREVGLEKDLAQLRDMKSGIKRHFDANDYVKTDDRSIAERSNDSTETLVKNAKRVADADAELRHRQKQGFITEQEMIKGMVTVREDEIDSIDLLGKAREKRLAIVQEEINLLDKEITKYTNLSQLEDARKAQAKFDELAKERDILREIGALTDEELARVGLRRAEVNALQDTATAASKAGEEIKELANLHDLLADSISKSLMENDAFIASFDNFASATEAANILSGAFASLAVVGIDMALEANTAFFESLVNVNKGMDDFGSALADLMLSLVEALPQLFLEAGVMSIIAGVKKTPTDMSLVTLGIGFLGGALAASVVSGVAQGAVNGATETNAHGNIYGSALETYARGGAFTNQIIDTPTRFNSGGSRGLLGEAGAEAIMPLARTSSGDLGIKSTGNSAPVNVIINNNANGTTTRTEESEGANGKTIEVFIDSVVKAGMQQGNYDKPMKSRYGVKSTGVRF